MQNVFRLLLTQVRTFESNVGPSVALKVLSFSPPQCSLFYCFRATRVPRLIVANGGRSSARRRTKTVDWLCARVCIHMYTCAESSLECRHVWMLLSKLVRQRTSLKNRPRSALVPASRLVWSLGNESKGPRSVKQNYGGRGNN